MSTGTAVGVLTQPLGSWQRPVAYLSKQLDTVARGLPSCLRAVAASVDLIKEANKLTLGQPLTVKPYHLGYQGRITPNICFEVGYLSPHCHIKLILWDFIQLCGRGPRRPSLVVPVEVVGQRERPPQKTFKPGQTHRKENSISII
uniref:Uncharacterized protein n=1 Tax=Anolis carolinensis TaxID=28377 RepID=A0A803SP74_ANOCA